MNMRQIALALLSVILLTGLSYAQFIQNPNPDFRLVHKHFTASDGETGVTTYTYDARGNAVKALWHLLDGSRSSLNLHTFDTDGNMIRKERLFSDQRNTVQQFEYDQNNRLLHETYERVDGVSGSADYKWSADGRLERVDCNAWSGWLTAVVTFNYDQRGRTISAQLKQDSTPVGTIVYSYDERGNLASETWSFSSGFEMTFRYKYDDISQEDRSRFTYSNVFVSPSSGEQVILETYDYSSEVSGQCVNMLWDAGALQYKEYKRSDDFVTKTDYFYDIRNRLTKSYRRYPDGKSAYFVYSFNDQDQLLEKQFFRSDGVRGHERYDYDAKGLLTRAEWVNFDSWLTGDIVLTSDEQNRLKSGHFAGEKFDAEIYFTHDETGRLTRIHWEFSYGGTQTYDFVWGEIKQ